MKLIRVHSQRLRSVRFLHVLLLVFSLPHASVNADSDSDSGALIFAEFVPVDTSRLMTTPHPYVLENAFPALDFGEKGPLQLLTAPDDADHLYVMCRDGQVFEFSKNANADNAKVFFDISGKAIRNSDEQGLFGFAFHPEYEPALFTKRVIWVVLIGELGRARRCLWFWR